MQAPGRIFFVGNSPQGGKLRARFQTDELPTAIQVKGTTDKQPVKCRRDNHGKLVGKWLSKNKYTSRLQTLQLFKGNKIIMECNYDACGDLVVDKPTVTISTNSSITLQGTTVNFVWTSQTEESVDQYTSEKKLSTVSTWEAFDADEPTGPGTTYYSTDVPTASGSYDYRLLAVFMDGTSQQLLTKTLQVALAPTPSATIQNFAAAYDTSLQQVNISWQVVQETGVNSYMLERGDVTGQNFEPVLGIDPIGVGSFTYPDFPNTGDYVYRLKAFYVNGSVDGVEVARAAAQVPATA